MTPRLLIEPARLAGSSVMRCQTDERLVDLVRAGNDRAFEAIVDRYRRPLVRYCSRLLPAARAEDAVQQAFMNAHAALQRDEARIELRPWLFRIAHNAALNALRESGWAHETIEAAAHRAVLESAHESAERRANLRAVLAAVNGLPERQRSAIILRELEGRSYEQIAVELDATGGAVRQLLNRARHTLRAAATALTPAGLLMRLPWGQSAPVLDRVTEAATHDGLRVGAARLGGALVASVALATGLSEGTRQLPRVAKDLSGGAPAERAAPRPAPGSLTARAPSGAVVRLPASARDLPRMAPMAPRAMPRPEPALPAPTPADPASALPGDAGSFAPRAAPAPAPASPSPAPPESPPGPFAHAAERSDGEDEDAGREPARNRGDETRDEDDRGERRRDRGERGHRGERQRDRGDATRDDHDRGGRDGSEDRGDDGDEGSSRSPGADGESREREGDRRDDDD